MRETIPRYRARVGITQMQASRALGIPRGVLRAIVRSGLVPPPPYQPLDLPVLAVAAATLTLPGTSTRDMQALDLTRGILAGPNPRAWLVLTAMEAHAVRDPTTLWAVLDGQPGTPHLLLRVVAA